PRSPLFPYTTLFRSLMTRNWKWLILAVTAFLAAGGRATAQEHTCNPWNTQVRCPAQQAASEQTLWECLFPAPAAHHGQRHCVSRSEEHTSELQSRGH